jgi:hypothetical protein
MPILNIVGSPQSVAGANGGKTYAFNNITNLNNLLVAPALPFRKKITFINPGGSVILYVSMVVQLNANGMQSGLVPTIALLGGTIPVFPGGMVAIDGECQVGWQALAASGTANPLTVLDSFA